MDGARFAGMRRILPLVFLLTAAVATHLHSQSVRGRLVVGDSELPVGGAHVVLLDAAGTEVAMTTSSGTGRFALRAPAGGRYLLRVARIGFSPWYHPLELEPDQTLDLVLSPTGTRFVLPSIEVAGGVYCGARAQGDSLSAMIWEQARIALAAADEAFAGKHYQFLSILESRLTDKQGRPLRRVTPGTGARATLSEWPVEAPPHDTLEAVGFIGDVRDMIAGPTWYGPDAAFLLSGAFFASYCFQVVGPSSKPVLDWMQRELAPDWIGLAFKPGGGSRGSGIVGVLWLDRESAELRRIEWKYDKVPKWARGKDAGGRIDFAALDDGGRIPQRWIMRVPVPTVSKGADRMLFAGYVDWGGHVAEV